MFRYYHVEIAILTDPGGYDRIYYIIILSTYISKERKENTFNAFLNNQTTRCTKVQGRVLYPDFSVFYEMEKVSALS